MVIGGSISPTGWSKSTPPITENYSYQDLVGQGGPPTLSAGSPPSHQRTQSLKDPYCHTDVDAIIEKLTGIAGYAPTRFAAGVLSAESALRCCCQLPSAGSSSSSSSPQQQQKGGVHWQQAVASAACY